MNGKLLKAAQCMLSFALVLGSASTVCLQRAWAVDVKMKSLLQRGDSATIFTDSPNMDVSIEDRDKDGKVVRSWSGRTDKDGRIAVNIGGKRLDWKFLFVNAVSNASTVEGIVLPSSISDKQPFTFAVAGTVEGQVVDIKTVDGEVVSSKKADQYGRIFLPAGLAAGAYLVTSSANGKPAGKIDVNPKTQDALQAPGQNQQALKTQIPSSINQSQPLCLTGSGFNPNAARNLVQAGSRDAAFVPVLAATDNEIKTGSLQGINPGPQPLLVANADNYEAVYQATFFFELSGHLVRNTIDKPKTNETRLIVTCQPSDAEMKVRVNVLSGPVNFGSGRKEAEVSLVGGKADLPVQADPSGSGPFRLSYERCEDPNAKVMAKNVSFSDNHPNGPASSVTGAQYYTDPWAWTGTDGWIPIPIEPNIAGQDPIKPVASGAARKVFLDWWKDYLEGMMSFEMLDGWITSPYHWPLSEDEVRAQARTQITALTDGAKKKLIQRLKDKAKKLRDKAKDLRKEGQDQKAQMADDQARAMDQAADEVGKSMSSGK